MMLRNAKLAIVVAVAFLGVTIQSGWAQSAGYEPGRGTAERTALLNTVRPAAEVDLGVPVEFVVRALRTEGVWAFLAADMQKPGGAAIQCFEIRRPGDCDFMDGFAVYALMVWQGDRWRLREMHISPTDVSWSIWPDQFGVPCRLVLPDDFCN